MTDRGLGRYILAAALVIGIAIHHSVSGGSFFMSNTPDEDDELSHLLMIDQFHASKGWGGFGYHLATFPSGRLYLCGNLNGARAHVASRNDELIGLVLIGTFTDTPPPASQIAAAASGVAFIRRTYPARPIGPHRNWALPEHATACPGDTWAGWLPRLETPIGDDDMTPDQERKLNEVHAILTDQVPFVWGGTVPRWVLFEQVNRVLTDPVPMPDGRQVPRFATWDEKLADLYTQIIWWVVSQDHIDAGYTDQQYLGANVRSESLDSIRRIRRKVGA